MNVLRLLYSALMLMSLLVRSAAADVFVDFNLPAAPLDLALGSFGRVTKEQLLLDAAITNGRRSSPVVGRFTPEAALRQMLAGTGLVVRSVDGQGYTVTAPSDDNVRETRQARRFDGYSALLQTALGKALCNQAATMPGTYRSMMRLRIDPGGAIDQAELLTSSGDPERDVRLAAEFRGLAVGVPPPGLPQPITLLVTSEGAGPRYCAKLGDMPGTAFEAR